MGDWLAVFAEPCKVELDGPPHLGQDCVLSVCQGDASRQIRAPCAVSAVAGSFYHDRVAGHGVLRSNPACLRMLRSVPGDNSALGLPAIVTRPGLSGCLYCRWLPHGADQVPAVSLDQLDYLTDLQGHRSLHPAL